MRTCLSVRGLSLIPLCIALVAASACSSSPTEPGAVSDSGIVTRSQSFETAATSTEGVKRVDADGPDSDELAGDEIDAAPLTANTATATASRTVEVSGVTKDKNGKRIAGVAVKIAGKRLDTTDSRGRFSINVRTGRTVTIKFSKTGYNDASETESVTRAIRNMNVRLTPLPAADSSSLTLSEKQRDSRNHGERDGHADEGSAVSRRDSLVVELILIGRRTRERESPIRKKERSVQGEG